MRQVLGWCLPALRPRWRKIALVGVLGLPCLLSCNGPEDKAAPAPEAEAPVVLGPENVMHAETRKLASGPVISGALQARHTAALRAEVGGVVLDVKVEQGQPVKRGELLARINDAGLKEQQIAARLAVRVAESSLEVAQSEEERNAKLARAEIITPRDHERAQLQRENAQAQLSEARARYSLAQEQLGHTLVTAPFAGVVSEQQVNAGDTVTLGSPLLTVVDPTNLRLVAAVPAEFASHLQTGAHVDFRISGHGDRNFTGTIEYINPVVDPATGQVRISVAIPNEGQTLLGGLFAQGRVASETRRALAVPVDAVNLSGTQPSVLRLMNGKVEQVPVELGLSDDVAQWVEVRSGLQEGDTVVMGSARDLATGTSVELSAAPARHEEPAQGSLPPPPR
ncbi:efflux RND transporter periplasmic adaptor subunit [Stigmatella sp. ncwal1]|uniref:Efflux RND transporter periplasmic adaptor subunit n=1 Tax=Stigmatella ashevillensis TaxID=2995309 RepID=A0ABT5DFR3_9BACT|nr:efflux RND transporter periplasmic adaptor subunit [Stigmatella ashevillena]MDC0712515.1 efflux RND transporter periplasmic adaptor subunit [Stigmatella ashevillena]